MGSFAGHGLPGSFFIFFGTWLAIRFSYQHFKAPQRKSTQKCCPCSWDIIEGLIKISCSSLGFLLEQVTNGGPKFHLINPLDQYQMGNNWSHCTMYSFFIFSGLADIIVAISPKLVFQGLQHLMMSLALLIEGYLFYFHTHGREELDVRLHTLLIIAIWTGALSFSILAGIVGMQPQERGPENVEDGATYTLLKGNNHMNGEAIQLDETETELYNSDTNSHDVKDLKQAELLVQALESKLTTIQAESMHRKSLPTFLKLLGAASILLQGTWFWQIAFVLYPPNGTPWNEQSHNNIEFATLFFAWHLASIVVFVSIICFLSYQCTKKFANG